MLTNKKKCVEKYVLESVFYAFLNSHSTYIQTKLQEEKNSISI